MNGRRAKQLRREIYGSDYSHRERTYARGPNQDKRVRGKDGKKRTVTVAGSIICTGRRRKYQDAKKRLQCSS